ncbi:MAG TPA: hypothetical protein VKU86_10490 [Acidimicrobiales bacterium]|nr:hypothetical protein [Acidimicrobiales bacterium]
MPTWVNPVLHAAQSLLVAGGVVALMVMGRLPVDTGVGILSGLGGAWAGVGGAVAVATKSAAANSAQGGQVPVPAPPAPAGVAQVSGGVPGGDPSTVVG